MSTTKKSHFAQFPRRDELEVEPEQQKQRKVMIWKWTSFWALSEKVLKASQKFLMRSNYVERINHKRTTFQVPSKKAPEASISMDYGYESDGFSSTASFVTILSCICFQFRS